MRQHKRSGFSLIETAIVLGIVGLVIGGIWTAAATVSENNKVNRMVDIIMSSTSKTKRLFDKNLPSVQTILTGSDCSAANIMLADSQTTSATGCGIDPWGGDIGIAVSLNVNGAPLASAKPGVILTTSLLSASACRAVISKILPSTTSYTLVYVVSDFGTLVGGSSSIPASFCQDETSLSFFFYMTPL